MGQLIAGILLGPSLFGAIWPEGQKAIFSPAPEQKAMIDAVSDLDIRIRAGLHTGDVELAAGSLHGIAVHAAARVSALAGLSEVLVSAVTRDLLEGSGLVFEERGVHELKGLSGARPVFALVRIASLAAH